MKKVKVLGAESCTTCETLLHKIIKLIDDNKYDATVDKITDIITIMNYGVMSVPSLVIDEKVFCTGRVPSDSELHDWLK